MQPELFKEFEAQQNKNAKKRFQGSILPRNYVLLNVSYEQVIFISIGIIMLMVLVFSLGVERGRGLASMPPKKQAEAVVKKALNIKPEPAKTEEKPIATEESAQPESENAKAPETKKDLKLPPDNLFTVQLIAYRSKKSAQKELSSLTKKGYKPFIVTGGGYYQVCVGEYKSQDSAQKVLRELKKGYPDGFIRKR